MVEVMKIMVTSFKSSHALQHSVPPTLQQAIVDPRLPQRLLDTHRQVWVSLLCGHCSFLLGPGVHKVLFVSRLVMSTAKMTFTKTEQPTLPPAVCIFPNPLSESSSDSEQGLF